MVTTLNTLDFQSSMGKSSKHKKKNQSHGEDVLKSSDNSRNTMNAMSLPGGSVSQPSILTCSTTCDRVTNKDDYFIEESDLESSSLCLSPQCPRRAETDADFQLNEKIKRIRNNNLGEETNYCTVEQSEQEWPTLPTLSEPSQLTQTEETFQTQSSNGVFFTSEDLLDVNQLRETDMEASSVGMKRHINHSDSEDDQLRNDHTSKRERKIQKYGTSCDSSINSSVQSNVNRLQLSSSSISLLAQPNNNEKRSQNLVYPTNREYQLNSNKEIEENPTIIIEPSEQDSRNYFSNHVKTFRAIQQSIIGRSGVIESTRNLKRKIQIIKLKTNDRMHEILSITNIGEFAVKVYKPRSQQLKIGLIGPIDLEVEAEDLRDLLNENDYKISRVERFILGKGESLRTTKTMKIWFEAENLPEYVNLMFQRFKVSPYIERAFQCYNCQKFGHLAVNCRNKITCLLCAGNHKVSDCPNKETNTKKCTNCTKDHSANFAGCPFMMREKEVQKIRAKNNLTYRDATLKYNSINRLSVSNREENATSNDHRFDRQVVHKVSVGTQTNINTRVDSAREEKVESNNHRNIPINMINNEKFALFLMEVIASTLKSPSLAYQCNKISDAFDNHLGVKINKNSLFKSITSNPIMESSQTILTKPVNPTSKS